MKKDNFEIFAKEKIHQQKCIADSESIWAAVEAELYPESNRKAIWLKWLPAVLLICSASLIAYMGYNNKTSEFYSLHSNTKIVHERKPKVGLNDNDIQHKLEASTKETNQNKVTAKNNISLIPKIESIQKTNEPKTTRQKIVKESNLKEEKSSYSSTSTKHIQAASIKSNILANSNNQEINPLNKLVSSAFENTNQVVQKSIVFEKEFSTRNEAIAKINLLDIHFLKANQKDIKDKLKGLNQGNSLPSETFIYTPKKFTFGINVSTGLAFTRTVLEPINNIDSDLLQVRSLTETDLETVDVDLGFSIKHKSGLYLHTGINYRRSARKLKYQSNIQSTEPVMGVLRLSVDPVSMNPSFIRADLTQIISTSVLRESYNTMQIINIPVELGYQIRRKNWVFGAEGGALFNLTTKQNGYIQDSAGKFYSIQNDPLNWFKDRLDLHIRSTAYLGYNFKGNYQLIIGPYVNTAVQLNENTNPVDQRQSALGVKASFQYWLK